jgi:hypothetical protein
MKFERRAPSANRFVILVNSCLVRARYSKATKAHANRVGRASDE